MMTLSDKELLLVRNLGVTSHDWLTLIKNPKLTIGVTFHDGLTLIKNPKLTIGVTSHDWLTLIENPRKRAKLMRFFVG